MLKWHTTQNTFFVADFDRTITDGLPGCATAFWVFPRAPKSSKKIQEQAKILFGKYYPIETNPDISEIERSKHMRKWNEEVMDLLGECIDTEQLDRIHEYAKDTIRIREWLVQGFQEISTLWIPLIVFSAWVSNVISEVLEHHNIPFAWIHSNELGFRNNRLQLVNDGVYIWHKWWESLPAGIKQTVHGKTHKIILWDSLDDLHMGDTSRVSTSVWFLNSEQAEKWRKEDYTAAFDHVVESDTSDLGILSRLIEELQITA